jgi:hypothetical protein
MTERVKLLFENKNLYFPILAICQKWLHDDVYDARTHVALSLYSRMKIGCASSIEYSSDHLHSMDKLLLFRTISRTTPTSGHYRCASNRNGKKRQLSRALETEVIPIR